MIKRIEKEVKMKGKRENKFSTFSDLGNRKKGQAAMEFLMTYGWAILAAIIVIGVLAIYFKPSSLRGSSAIVTSPFYVNAWNIDSDTDERINLELVNNAGETVWIKGITITGTGASAGTTCTMTTAAAAITAGQVKTIDVGTGCTFTPNQKFTGDIAIAYTRDATGLGTELISTGTIADTARDIA